MILPFTIEQFVAVFVAYDGVIWPAQVVSSTQDICAELGDA